MKIGKYVGDIITSDSAGYEDWKAGKSGKWVTSRGHHLYLTKGKTPKQLLMEKVENIKKTKKEQPKEEKKEEKKEVKKKEPKKRRSVLTEKERRMREIEKVHSKLKRPKELSEREKKVQKLIEQHGYERKRAESIIDEKMKKEKEPEQKEQKNKQVQKKEVKKLSQRKLQKQQQLKQEIANLHKENKSTYKSGTVNKLLDIITKHLATGDKNSTQFLKAYRKLHAKKMNAQQKAELMKKLSSLRNKVKSVYDMDEKELKKITDELDLYAKEHNLNDEEKETLYRTRLMPYFSKASVKTNDFTYDFIETTEFNDITLDFKDTEDFTILHGPITRAGPFEYEKEGMQVIYYKDWDNIKKVFKQHKYIPLKASVKQGSHHADILGYATNWKPNNKTQQMFADVVLIKDIDKLTDILYPENGYAVSIGFKDDVQDNVQWIEYIDHLAMSLSNADKDRCSTANGLSCNVSVKNNENIR